MDALDRPQTESDILHGMVRELYPLCRSLSGNGVRDTLKAIARHVPLRIREVPTGTPVLDWEVPREWNIRGARIEAMDGRVLVDFARSNLHVVSYSKPVDAVVSRDELARHVHTLPEQPSLVPYRTGYYADDWGFCLSHDQWQAMTDPQYRVVVDSTLAPGSVSYGELFLRGEREEEVLLSIHCCHPSLANDNLSGIAIATRLALRLAARRTRLSYRFLFVPGTIGSICWLAHNDAAVQRIRHGLVLTCLGDAGEFHYKQSRRGNATIDRVVPHVLGRRGIPVHVLPYAPTGYDERQYCSPGYNLPVGCFMRSPNGTFPEYHTSADNPDFVTGAAMEGSLEALTEILSVIDADTVYQRVDGRGEPQLGRRGLYRAIAGQKEGAGATQMALLWVLNLADGAHTLLDMAERSGLPFRQIEAAARLAVQADLIFERDF